MDRVLEHTSEQQENLRATSSLRRFGERRLEQTARSSQVADVGLPCCRLEHARPVLRALGWAGLEGGQRELGGHTGRAALARQRDCVVERAGDAFIGAGRRSSEMPRLVLDVARGFGQRGMGCTALTRCRRGVDRG